MRPSSSAPASVSRKASSQGAWTSRNSSTATAIAAAISATRARDRFGAASVTRKNTIVPHSMEPPYFTTRAGSPTPSPNLRKPRPHTMVKMQSEARMADLAKGVRSQIIRHRDGQFERGALFGIDQPYRAAMGLQHGADDRKPHAGAAGLAAGGEEAVENLRPVVGRDAFAVVGDSYQQQILLPHRGQI